MSEVYIGKTVIIQPDWNASDDFPSIPFEGSVIASSLEAIAVRLNFPVFLRNGTEADHLVASIRHAGTRMEAMSSEQALLCGLTLVPTTRFDPANPLDVSWWRGGGAAVGDVWLAPVASSK